MKGMEIKTENAYGSILAAIAAGLSVREACGTERVRNALKHAMVKDEPLRNGYELALAAGASKRKPRFPARIFSAKRRRLERIDDVLTLVSKGLPLEEACRRDKNFPTADQFRGRMRSDAALRKRYEAAKHVYRHPMSPRQRAAFRSLCRRFHATKFAFIERRVAGGVLPANACKEVSLGIHVARLHFSRSKALCERWNVAKAACRIMRSQKFGALRYVDEIISQIEFGSPTREVLAAMPHYPSLKGFRYALDSVPDLRFRYDRAIAANRAKLLRRRKIQALRNTDRLLEIALECLPRHLDPDARHDIAADIVVAVLAGDISRHQLKTQVRHFISTHNKHFSAHRNRSLDEPFFSDSTVTLVDTLTNGWDS